MDASPSTLQLTTTTSPPRRAEIEQALRTAIRGGRLQAGTRLPSTRAFAADLGVARGTVVEAFAQLHAEGYLEIRRGAGAWVAAVELARSMPVALRDDVRAAPQYNFNGGLPDLTAFPRTAWATALRRALQNAPASVLSYGDPRGRPELRSALAAYLSRARGAIVDPELVFVCAGFGHGLSLVARVLRGAGASTVAMEDPCLAWHRGIVATAGLSIVSLPVDGRGAQVERLDSSGADAVVLTPAHQYPLGSVLDRSRRLTALEWARANGAILIEDDYDAELRYDRQAVGALQALDPERVVYAGTTSKTLAPGLRLGWLVVPESLVEPLTQLRGNEDLHVPVLDQLAFTELLLSGGFERHVRKMRGSYRKRRDRVVSVFADRAPSITPVGISAGLRVLFELPPSAPRAAEIVEIARLRSIELHAVTSCYRDRRPPREGLIIGYAAPAAYQFEAALAALADVLEESLTS